MILIDQEAPYRGAGEKEKAALQVSRVQIDRDEAILHWEEETLRKRKKGDT